MIASAWVTFWGGLLVASLALFAALAVVVTIGGVRDLRSMLGRFEAERRDRGRQAPGGRSEASKSERQTHDGPTSDGPASEGR